MSAGVAVATTGDHADLLLARLTLLGPRRDWDVPTPALPLVPAMLAAVWSIANRRTTVDNVVRRYAAVRGRAGADARRDTPAQLAAAIRASGGPAAFAEAIANRQRTGARGPLRTQALLELADVLVAAGVTDADRLRGDPGVRERARSGWTTVSGQGSGISWDRFLQLCDVPRTGSDAMVRRFAARALGLPDGGVSDEAAVGLTEEVARRVGTARRTLELAVWRYEMEGGDGLAEARRRQTRERAAPGEPIVPAPPSAPPAPRAGSGPSTARIEGIPDPTVPVPGGPGPLGAPTGALERGTPGASARREYERRLDRHQRRVRRDSPLIGNLLLAVQDEPQRVRAWEKGAEGEETVGRSLERRCDPDVVVLHDRRIPGTRANIDHLTVGRAGVWVVDTKHYAGKAAVARTSNGRTRLTIDGRDCSTLIEKLAAQVALVTAAVAQIDGGVPVHGALCMVETDLPLLRPLTFGGFPLLHPKALARRVSAAGPLAERRVQSVARGLAEHFGPA